MKQRYWEWDQPQIVQDERNTLMWYPVAGKLQISRPGWVDGEGVEHRGKTVTFDVRHMRRDPKVAAAVRGLLIDVASKLD